MGTQRTCSARGLSPPWQTSGGPSRRGGRRCDSGSRPPTLRSQCESDRPIFLRKGRRPNGEVHRGGTPPSRVQAHRHICLTAPDRRDWALSDLDEPVRHFEYQRGVCVASSVPRDEVRPPLTSHDSLAAKACHCPSAVEPFGPARRSSWVPWRSSNATPLGSATAAVMEPGVTSV